jgi:RNA polymerase sigma-70 factor, ECF subfamily
MSVAWTRTGSAAHLPSPSAAPPSDNVLIERIASGDRLAMQVLFARHRVRVYRWLKRLVRDDGVAEDLLSEVFLEVWRRADSFRADASVATWLLAIARYKTMSALRRRTDASLDEETATAIPDPSDGPDVVLEKKDDAEYLRHALLMLSQEHREVLDLVYYHGQSVKAVAEILGIREATVKTRMFYARKRLASLLGDFESSRRRRCTPIQQTTC